MTDTSRYGIAAVLCVLLFACGAERSRLPTQEWQDVVVGVETRPAPVVVGMNEFLVSATRTTGGAGHDLLVFIRMHESEPWTQSIQDGRTGIYRRAIAVGAVPQTLQVRVKRAGEETVLMFPLH
ncbi:MAG: hypothetical protein O2845_02750 [Proteobacteria bacterium]|nr:hypothetical protein [Pseudomonadota bacterium]